MSPEEEASTARAGGVVLDLSDRAKFTLQGADRVRYLNGQVSQAVTTLGLDETRTACVMTAKGKLNAFIHFFATQDLLHLDAAPAQREQLSERLERYIIADDVELNDVTDEESLFHVFGVSSVDLDLNLPEVTVRNSNRFNGSGVDVLTPRPMADEVRAALLRRWPLCSPATAHLLRIEGGVPAWGAELDENTIPVEAGLDRTAIDYHKGCYIGQEVISRLKSMGHVNRQMRGLVAAEGEKIDVGMELISAEGKIAGAVTSVSDSFALARSIGLGYVRRGVTSDILLARVPGSGNDVPLVRVEVRDLPLVS